MIRGGRDGVTWTMRPTDAHDLGRYLADLGARERDGVEKDGLGHECREPGDCRVEAA